MCFREQTVKFQIVEDKTLNIVNYNDASTWKKALGGNTWKWERFFIQYLEQN